VQSGTAKEKPLQLTVSVEEKDVKIGVPFSKIEPKAIVHSKDNQIDMKGIHVCIDRGEEKVPQ
jgi:hypothetical protein